MVASKENVAMLVQKYLRKDDPAGSAVRVVADEVRLADAAHQWWWVPVIFDSDPFKRYVYYMLFSKVEEQLEENEKLNVLLVPRPTPSTDDH
jgi:hypothetical protein